MVPIELNMKRYVELLIKEETLQNQGKNIIDEILNSTTNKEDMLELLEYRAMLEDERTFQEQKNYLKVIENYLEEKITTMEFEVLFDQLYWKTREQSLRKNMEEKLRKNSVFTLSVDSRAKRYCALIHSIFAWNERLSDEEKYQISVAKHRQELTQVLVAMKKLLVEK